MGQITILRRDFSGYFGSNFKELEASALEQSCARAGAQSLFKYTTSIAECEGETIILTNSQSNFENFPKELLHRTSLLIHANSGYDNISLDFVREARFPIVVGNELRAQAVASFVIACLFEATNAPPFKSEWDKSRQWPRKLLSEHNILILGHGHIGEIVSRVLTTLGAKLQIQDPYKKLVATDISSADVIIPLASLNPTSHSLIDQAFLSQLKEDVLIINAARGALIDSAALLDFLSTHKKARAYLDVFANEPADLALFSPLENVKTSSHVAGVYQNLDQKLIEFESRILFDFLSDQEPKEVFKKKYQRDILSNRIYDNYLI